MTHLYIKLCDLCGTPCEVDSGMHGGNIRAEIMVHKGKGQKQYSIKAFNEEFDFCVTCGQKVGILPILIKMKEMKDKNVDKAINFKKLLEDKKLLYK